MVTHVLDTSASLAQMLDEPGADTVDAILLDGRNTVAVSVLTLLEVWTTYLHRTESPTGADEAVANLRVSVSEVLPVTESVLDLAFDLRRHASARIALADLLIAATAALHGAILVHRDPHFASLPDGHSAQESLPDKA